MTDIQHPTPADILVGQTFAAHVRAEIAADEFDGLRCSWLRFLGAHPAVEAKYYGSEETAAWLLVVTVGEVAKGIEQLTTIVRDAAPMMMTVTAYGADEADKNALAEMARWYVEQDRDYSSFDVWLDASKARKAGS